MRTKRLLILISAFIAGTIMRKSGWNFGSLILVVSGLMIAVIFIYDGIRSLRSAVADARLSWQTSGLIPGVALLLALFRIQYWIYIPELSIGGFFLLVVYTPVWYRKKAVLSQNPGSSPVQKFKGIYLLFIWLVVLPGVFMNPRQYHNFFRASWYEEYIRNSLPDSAGVHADRLIGMHADQSEAARAHAALLLQSAEEQEKEKNYSEALRLYNGSIDLDPGNADAYFKRGVLKFYRLDMDIPVANSAVKDFSTCIRLRPSMAQAWYQRGVIYAYLELPELVCQDMKRALELDSTLKVKGFILKYCVDSGSPLPEKLHP